jgi:hypothetical protein
MPSNATARPNGQLELLHNGNRCDAFVCFPQLRTLILDEDGSVTASSDKLQQLIRLAAVDKEKVRDKQTR